MIQMLKNILYPGCSAHTFFQGYPKLLIFDLKTRQKILQHICTILHTCKKIKTEVPFKKNWKHKVTFV